MNIVPVVKRTRNDLPIKSCTAYECQIIQLITGTLKQCERNEKRIEERLRTIPNGWRDWRLMLSILRRMSDALIDTMPDKEITYLDRMLKHGEILVRFRPPIRDNEYQLVEDEALTRMVNEIMENECAICFKEGREIKHCQLRKDLEGFAPCTNPYDPMVECGYKRVIASNKMGDYVEG